MIHVMCERSSQSAEILRHSLSALQIEEHSTPMYVNWGTTSSTATAGRVLNNKKLDGLQQLQALKEANIHCPAFTDKLEEAYRWTNQGWCVFGRNLNHTQGRDLVSVLSLRFPDKDFWVRMVQNIEDEWRFHIVAGRSIQRQHKIYTNEDGGGHPQHPIRNRRHGWTMERSLEPNSNLFKRLRETAKAAVSALGYDFGAVDLATTADDHIYVFEVNRAPGLDDYSASRYADAFNKIYQGTWSLPNEHTT